MRPPPGYETSVARSGNTLLTHFSSAQVTEDRLESDERRAKVLAKVPPYQAGRRAGGQSCASPLNRRV
jgi:hypothetical protein